MMWTRVLSERQTFFRCFYIFIVTWTNETGFELQMTENPAKNTCPDLQVMNHNASWML